MPENLFDILEHKIVDIIILELDLQKSDGLAVLRRIKNEHPGVRVLIFSSQPEEVYAISSLKAGASGYLNKKANPTAPVRNPIANKPPSQTCRKTREKAPFHFLKSGNTNPPLYSR